MYRNPLEVESLPPQRQWLVRWAQKRTALWVNSLLTQQSLSHNPDVQELTNILHAPWNFGDLTIAFRKPGGKDRSERPADFAEFAFVPHPPSQPESERRYMLRPAIFVRNKSPFLEYGTYGLMPPDEFLIDQLPKTARIALEMTTGMAAMHYLALHNGENGNLAYFHEGVTMASRLTTITNHLGNILNIPQDMSRASIGPGVQIALGLEDLVNFVNTPEQNMSLRRERIEEFKAKAQQYIDNPINFIFSRAVNATKIAAAQDNFRYATVTHGVVLQFLYLQPTLKRN